MLGAYGEGPGDHSRRWAPDTALRALFLRTTTGSSERRTRMPVAFANRSSVDKLGLAAPLSRRAIVDCEVPIFFATSCWDSLAFVLASISMLASANSASSA